MTNEDYSRKVLPYLKDEYFDNVERTVFSGIEKYILQYNTLPTKESLIIDIEANNKLSQEQINTIVSTVNEISSDASTKQDINWLITETEKFAKDRALYNAISKSIKIIDDEKNGKATRGIIPDILNDALAVSFDSSVGHDYMDNANDRFDFYHKRVRKIQFDIDMFNKITDGGFEPKTLNCILASTGVGKTFIMCHMAANCIRQGYNVLYLTLEMDENMIGWRIDANLMDVTCDDIKSLSKPIYDKKIADLNSKIKGKLLIKQYPPISMNINHIKSLIKELSLKKKFVPDIIFVDYLNLMSSSRVKLSNSVNSYTLVKSVAEELRSIAVIHNVPVVSATQTNRQGITNSDIEMTEVSESIGLAFTCDLLIAAIRTEELDAQNQILFKQLKNRYMDMTTLPKFCVGMNRPKMKLHNVRNDKGLHPANTTITSKLGGLDGNKGKPASGLKFDGFKI